MQVWLKSFLILMKIKSGMKAGAKSTKGILFQQIIITFFNLSITFFENSCLNICGLIG